MGPRIDMTGWIMSEHGVPDSLIVVIGLDEENKEKRWKRNSFLWVFTLETNG